MKILFAVNSLYFLRSHRMPLVREAQARGYITVIAAGPDSSADDRAAEAELLGMGIPIHRFRLTRSGTGAVDLARTVLSLRSLYREVEPDLVHHVTPKVVTLGTLAASLANVPAVVNAISGLGIAMAGGGASAGFRSRVVRTFYRWTLRHRNQAIIVQNDRDLEFMRSLGLPRRTTFDKINGSGVDLSKFRASPLPGGVPIVVLAARLLREKGVLEFAEASRILKRRGIQMRFQLCGALDPGNPGTLTDAELRAITEDGSVEYLGRRNDISEVYAQASVVCLPSYYGEGLPLTLAEGAAAGRAIVTTDMPGCRDTLVDGVTGYLVKPRDPADLADKLQRLVETSGVLESFGTASRRFAEERFSVESVVAEHFRIYSLHSANGVVA